VTDETKQEGESETVSIFYVDEDEMNTIHEIVFDANLTPNPSDQEYWDEDDWHLCRGDKGDLFIRIYEGSHWERGDRDESHVLPWDDDGLWATTREECKEWAKKKDMVEFVNLMACGIISDEDEGIIIPPSGQVARVTIPSTLLRKTRGISLYRSIYGQVQNLPPPKVGVAYIVSWMVRKESPNRKDLWSPNELVQTEDGNPIGYRGLIR